VFSSRAFYTGLRHIFNFTHVLRQKERELASAVNDLCEGHPSPETITFLRENNF
jgi:hypothetical protein